MRRRTRIFAFLALVAMTGALAEGVLASACVPGMDMGNDGMSMDAELQGHGDGEGDRSEREELPSDGSDCPFAPVVAQGCLAVASIPATGAVFAVAASERGDRPTFTDVQHDVLLHRALFHPPRS